jgi:hypothetical protein
MDHIDVFQIEREARRLRAEYNRTALKRLGSWFRGDAAHR